MGMTAHVVFSAYDPVAPATTSVTMVQDVICDSIGFEGLLMSDDISMGALSGSLAERAGAALTAGCDIILDCNGQMDEMRRPTRSRPWAAWRRGARRPRWRRDAPPCARSILPRCAAPSRPWPAGGRAAGARMVLS